MATMDKTNIEFLVWAVLLNVQDTDVSVVLN